MTDHGARAHATWSASATSRNWACPGSLVLSQQAPVQPESEAAGWGTACHQVAEKCLRNGQDAIEYIGRIEKTKERSFEVDEEMAETAQTYVDYVRNRYAPVVGTFNGVEIRATYDGEGGNVLQIEQRFSLEKLNPPFDAGGTADAVIYFPDDQLLEVIDLKGGRGVKVEVTENKQLRTYALGAMLANPSLAVRRVKSTVVQPRAPHKDGTIRSEEYHVADLIEWTADLMAAMAKAADAKLDYGYMTGALTRQAWADKHLVAGDHCKFCPAAGFCPKLEKRALDAAHAFFDDQDKLVISNTPDALDPSQIAKVLDSADMIEDWLSAVRGLAHTLADSGVQIPGYIFVDKIGRRKWADEVKAEEFLRFGSPDLSDEDVFTIKLKSPAQIEKVLGAKRKGLISDLIETPVTGKNLVREDKTTRKAVASAVHQHFKSED